MSCSLQWVRKEELKKDMLSLQLKQVGSYEKYSWMDEGPPLTPSPQCLRLLSRVGEPGGMELRIGLCVPGWFCRHIKSGMVGKRDQHTGDSTKFPWHRPLMK